MTPVTVKLGSRNTMAQRGKPIDVATRTRIKELAQVTSMRKTAALSGVAYNTATKYAGLPQPKKK